jgi:HlyD family secretion protein
MKFVRVMSVLSLVVFITACEMMSTEETPTPRPVREFTPMVSVTGKVVPERWAVVSTQVGGIVQAVYVEEGETVTEGAVLVRFDDTDAQVAVRQAEAAVTAAQMQVARLKVPPRPEAIAVAEAQVNVSAAVVSQTIAQRDQLYAGVTEAEIAAAQAEVRAAEAELNLAVNRHDEAMCHGNEPCPTLGTFEEQARYTMQVAQESLEARRARLRALQASAGTEIRAAQAAVDVAIAQRDVSKAQLALSKITTLPEEIAVAEAAVQEAKVALEAAQVALSHTEVHAPFAGTIGQLDVRLGEFVAPGQPLFTLGDLSTLRVETTDLDEIDVAQITLGQQATVTFDALPDRPFTGHIVYIAPMADPGGGGVNYKVVLEVAEWDPVIRWGMTAFVDIEVQK